MFVECRIDFIHRKLYSIPAEEMRLAKRVSPAECAQWVYCGMPYYLPVLSLVPASHRGPAREPPRTRLHATLTTTNVNETHAQLQIHMTGECTIIYTIISLSFVVESRPPCGPTYVNCNLKVGT